MNVCTKCGDDHDRWRDAEHTKPASWCSHCYAAYLRENRPKHSELNDVERRKRNIRKQTYLLERKGKIVRKECCEKCTKPEAEVGKLERHHPKYSKPGKIVYLCRPCHVEVHLEERRLANEKRAAAGRKTDRRTAYRRVKTTQPRLKEAA